MSIARVSCLTLLGAVLTLAPLSHSSGAERARDTVTVFAAASLADALHALEDVLRVASVSTRYSFAASSVLARQIEAGAPADIFLSANERWMDHLQERGMIDVDTRTSPIGNRLVLIAPASSPIAIERLGPTTDLAAALGPGARLALGDPQHVPAGIYARQALEHLGLWSQVAERLALADNVRAALALVERGETPLGIVYATDVAIARSVRIVVAVPSDSHRPIRYPFAVLSGRARPATMEVFRRLIGPAALATFRRFGFEMVPGKSRRAE